ncbi:C4-dicarboxylate-binding protein DctP [Maridesulfovibrio ferrireducens]|uniref:C4-dicarboxylate-binding protein DctP n=1 Tax=Maridesulfovibrio ferrireducens TaxID=246191 RepID=A0A1G9L5S0_9BACT|nr:TRAP transporter substrate-binding protein [Maridesulfovibrio ferrireducens]SDL57281.1 C4-dicarboxylate-binding protein DctP [Maridesulfovibrio ferrireducens]
MKLSGRIVSIALALCMVLGGVISAGAAEFEARIGHIESALQPRHQGLEKVAKLVKERTNGAVEFKIFPSSQLGNQRQINEGVQFGTIEGTVSAAAFLGGFNPSVSIMDIPFLLPTDRAKAQELRQGKFGKELLKSFGPRGFKAVGTWPNGRKNFTSNKPLGSVEAYKGQRFRVMDSKILIEQFSAIGASAIALPFGELYTALQNGVVDGEENPLDTIQRMKFYEVQKYLVLSEHGAMEDFILFNPSWWDSLPAKYQDVITAAFMEVMPGVEVHKEQAQKDALAVIKKAGVKVSPLSDADRATMRSLMYPKTIAAYLDRAGSEGEKLVKLYEAEYKRIVE